MGVPYETPPVAVEVVSESQTLVELALKAQTYRQAGVDEVWVVDHQSRTIEIWGVQGRATLTDAQTLTSPTCRVSVCLYASSWMGNDAKRDKRSDACGARIL